MLMVVFAVKIKEQSCLEKEKNIASENKELIFLNFYNLDCCLRASSFTKILSRQMSLENCNLIIVLFKLTQTSDREHF